MALTFNKEAGLNAIAAKVQNGLDRGLHEMTAIAIEKAPVRKDRSRRSTREREDIVKTSREQFVNDSSKFRFAASNITAYRRAFRTGVASLAPGSRSAAAIATESRRAAQVALTNRGTGTFTFKFTNARTGEEVTNLGTRRGRLTARASVRGGNLKSKIRRTEITRDGSRIEGKLTSGATYSAPMEFGFDHVGGTHVPAQPFMRPAKAHYKSNWRTYFKR
jgi:hypothetical protein